MEISTKTIIAGGSVAGALVAIFGGIYGAMAFSAPYLVTKPPFESQTEAETKFNEVAQNFQTFQRNSAAMFQQQMMLSQGFWSNQLAQAQFMLRQNPNNMAARQQANIAQQNLNAIQSNLYGTP